MNILDLESHLYAQTTKNPTKPVWNRLRFSMADNNNNKTQQQHPPKQKKEKKKETSGVDINNLPKFEFIAHRIKIWDDIKKQQAEQQGRHLIWRDQTNYQYFRDSSNRVVYT